MRDGLCPHCGRLGRWTFSNYSVSYPPTGGDYTWAETDGKAHCPHCKTSINVRLRIDLDDGSVDKIVYSPFPTASDWHYYVVAEVKGWSDDDFQVKINRFVETLEEAERVLKEEYYGGYNLSYERKGVFQISAAGYTEVDGRPLHESTNKRINYA